VLLNTHPLPQVVLTAPPRQLRRSAINILPMMKSRLLICLLIQVLFVLPVPAARSSTPKDDVWSPTVNGLQTRLTLVEGESHNGTRWIVPYLELRNVRSEAAQMEVNCDRHHLTIELVNDDGKPIRSGWLLPRSGPPVELNVIVLPWHSSIKLSLENGNWGVPRNQPAMVSTDSGAWVLADTENGKVFLRATLTDEPIKPYAWKRWYGTIQSPPVKVDWK